MLTLFIKFVQSLVKSLHSEGSPTQVALGIALGACLGLTPLMTLHNVVVLAAIVLLNVSFAGGMLGWLLFTPIGFVLDPVSDSIGRALLEAPSLQAIWTDWYNIPIVPLTEFNNSVVLGSLLISVVLFVPVCVVSRFGIIRYRATLGARVSQLKIYKAIRASKLYNVYRLFRPD